jgi:putative addiction module component (TIGR02574 family)
MSTNFAGLEAQALELSPEERVRLADHLLASVSEGVAADIDTAWDEELQRRLAELDAGGMDLVSVEDAVHRARAALR